MMKGLDHHNIIRPVGFKKSTYKGKPASYMALPLKPHGDLFDLVNEAQGLHDSAARIYFR